MNPEIIRPVPPFSFHHTSAIFACGDPAIRSFHDNRFSQVVSIGNHPALVEVQSRGTVSKPEISFTLLGAEPLPAHAWRDARGIIVRIFGTDDDLAPFYRSMETDPVMADLAEQLKGLRAPTTPTVFEALTDSIIEQQISLKAARSIENRLIRAVGKQLNLNGTVYYAYPEADALAQTTDGMFRSCGLTLRKGEYIRDISQKIVDGDLDVERFRDEPDTETIITGMTELRGIGRWTAELTILRGLHRPDAFPADDVGVRRFVSQYYLGGEKITSTECRLFSNRWGKWKGFAAYYLEVADLLGIRPRDPVI